ncbi:MAG: HAD-IA family hydrolase [Treponema sp.]|nr:HAD-IA family hydrolase [Treponema sp.]
MGVIKYLLFDLDNTLYSRHYGLEDAVYQRIMEFAGAYLGISPDEARHQRVTAKVQYGTSLEWLMTEEGFTDVEAFLASVHPPGETAPLVPDGDLRAFLAAIPIPRAILTNSPREHAVAVLEKLRLRDMFTHIFDIRSNNFIGKPHRESFENALHTLGVNAEEVLFIDDYPSYVEGFVAIGGKGLLFDEDDVHKNFPLPRIRELREIVRHLGGH